ESHAVLERGLELGNRDREALEHPQDIHEPQPDEANRPFLDGPQDVVPTRCGWGSIDWHVAAPDPGLAQADKRRRLRHWPHVERFGSGPPCSHSVHRADL